MYQCVPRCQKSLLLHVFLTSCNLTTSYKIFLIAVITVARRDKRELSNLPIIGHLPSQSQQYTEKQPCERYTERQPCELVPKSSCSADSKKAV